MSAVRGRADPRSSPWGRFTIVPVGFDVGPCRVMDSGRLVTRYQVQTAADVTFLRQHEYRVWKGVCRFGRIDQTLETLTITATGAAPEPEPLMTVIDRLLDNDLLYAIRVDQRDGCDRFLRAHRLAPQGHGLGSTPEHPHVFRIGRRARANKPAEVHLEVPPLIYAVWARSSLDATLDDAIAGTAYDYDLDDADWLVLRDAVTRKIPELVGCETAFLQQAPLHKAIAAHASAAVHTVTATWWNDERTP